MGNYSCPICGENVPPVAVGRITDSGRLAAPSPVALGRITDGGRLVGPTPDGLLIEKKPCRACGEPLERISGYRWHVEGTLRLDPVPSGFR
jgi:hypothetical protein